MSDLWGRCPGLIDYCSEDVHGVANEEWGGGQSINLTTVRNPREISKSWDHRLKFSRCNLSKISVKSCSLGPKNPTVLDGMTAEDMERDLFVVE